MVGSTWKWNIFCQTINDVKLSAPHILDTLHYITGKQSFSWTKHMGLFVTLFIAVACWESLCTILHKKIYYQFWQSWLHVNLWTLLTVSEWLVQILLVHINCNFVFFPLTNAAALILYSTCVISWEGNRYMYLSR